MPRYRGLCEPAIEYSLRLQHGLCEPERSSICKKGRMRNACNVFLAFVIGGLICVIGQLLFDVAKLSPGHTMSVLVTAGAILSASAFMNRL